jgi:7,8-dihydropterin-6-yl-methyl-4-(beta-D-ribofuranosyl)aminobenzene 5'-phosphate synthase
VLSSARSEPSFDRCILSKAKGLRTSPWRPRLRLKSEVLPEAGTERVTVGEVGEGGDVVRMIEWVLMGLLGLLVAGCALPTPLPRTPTAAPTRTPAPTVTLIPRQPQETASPPTSTIAPTPTSTRPLPTATLREAAGGVTITVFYDNNEYDERLETAWGFSCLVEGPEKTILFDTGGDGALLLRNMRTLGIDPKDVDVVVISHVHGDHVGGLVSFLEENPAVTVYLPQSFPKSIKDATREAGAELVEVREPVEICEHVHSTGELGDGIKEQSLVVETSQGLVVITGCAHPGVVNIVRRAKELTGGEVYLVLGGFHLGGASEAGIASIVEDFQQLGVQRVAPCHCSGDVARRLFEEAYREDYIPAGVGSRLEVRG